MDCLRKLWKHAMLLKYSKMSEVFDDHILPIWGPCDSLNHGWGRKNRENCVFRDFKSQNGDKNTFKTFFEEKILLFSFPNTYLGPYLGPNASRVKKRCDFSPSIFQERVLLYQKSDSGGPK